MRSGLSLTCRKHRRERRRYPVLRVIPKGTLMPQGMGVLRDGVDVGGLQPPTHATIFPTKPMAQEAFIQRFLDLPWVYGGKK